MLKFLGYRAAVWLLICVICRAVFISFHHQDAAFSDIIFTFFYGLRLDLSILGYLLIATLLLGIWRVPVLTAVNKWVFALLLFAQLGITIIDIGLYQAWQHTINYQFFEYMRQPSTAMGNLSVGMNMIALLGLLVNGLLAYYLAFYKHPQWKPWKHKNIFLVPVFLMITGFSILLSRGGIQVAPINISFAFFSKYTDLNYAAINSTWNFVFTLLNSQSEVDQEMYRVVPVNDLDQQFTTLFPEDFNTPSIVKKNQPNVVIILLESFSANLVGYTGAAIDATPNLNSIAAQGLAFTNAYASGNRTDKGIAATISGFPAQANASIVTIPSKAQKLPSLIKEFNSRNYSTTFYYGGEPEFANMKAYLLNMGIQNMATGFDYSPAMYKGKWGVQDADAFERLAKEIKNEKKPFFKLMLTISSHEPFDYPNKPTGLGTWDEFKAAMTYTDSCLGVFWEQVKNTPNTLFIFAADHGRVMGNPLLDRAPWVYKMPIVVAGTALQDSFKGLQITHVVNQHHLPSNVLQMIGYKDYSEKFQFQQSWFDNTVPAYFTFYNGVGLVQDSFYEIYSNDRKQYEDINPLAAKDSLGYKARIYQQKVMEVFDGF